MLFPKYFRNLLTQDDIFGKGPRPTSYSLIILKGGYLDFSHLIELKNIYITEISMKKQYKSSIIKNHKITKKIFIDGVPLKDFVAS